MFIGCSREHHSKAKTSQKVTAKFAKRRQKKQLYLPKTGMDSPNTKISRGN